MLGSNVWSIALAVLGASGLAYLLTASPVNEVPVTSSSIEAGFGDRLDTESDLQQSVPAEYLVENIEGVRAPLQVDAVTHKEPLPATVGSALSVYGQDVAYDNATVRTVGASLDVYSSSILLGHDIEYKSVGGALEGGVYGRQLGRHNSHERVTVGEAILMPSGSSEMHTLLNTDDVRRTVGGPLEVDDRFR